MKKLFGIFLAGAAALTLASCEEDNNVEIVIPEDENKVPENKDPEVTESDLPDLFAAAFSKGGLTNVGSATIGTHTFNVESKEVYTFYDVETGENLTEYSYSDVSASIAFGSTGLIFDLNIDSEYGSGDSIVKDTTNIIADQTALYIKSIASDSGDYEYSYIQDLLDQYGYLFEGVEASDYDYAKFSYESVMPLLELILGDISVIDINENDLSGIFAELAEFEYSISDLMIEEFTTYQLVSQTEAYATVDFQPFNAVAYELVYDTLNYISQTVDGEELNADDFRLEWDSIAEDYADLAVQFEFGINPTSGAITKISLDTTAIFEALGDESFFKFEYIYAENLTTINAPTDRVLDADPIIPVIIEEIEAGNEVDAYEYFTIDAYKFCYLNEFIEVYLIPDEDGIYFDDEIGWYNELYTVNEELLAIYEESGYTLSDLDLETIPQGWTLLDWEKSLITTDGTNFYLNLYWEDGSSVFTDPVLITADEYFFDNIYENLDLENFNPDYLYYV